MYIKLLSGLLIVCLLFSGCSSIKDNQPEIASTISVKEPVEESFGFSFNGARGDQFRKYDKCKESARQAILQMEIGIPEDFDKEKMSRGNIFIEAFLSGRLEDSVIFDCILLGTQSMGNDWILAIINGENIVYHYIGSSYTVAPGVYFADIDGDGLDEIITHCGTLASGRTGPYQETAVFKWKDDGLQRLYHSTDIEHPERLIDTGFEIIFSNGYKGTVRNTHTRSETVFDASAYLFYGENGKLHDPAGYIEADKPYRNIKGRADNFLTFKPVDIDGDGVYEILASERFFINYQGSWGVGTSYAALKYDVQTNGFFVIKSAYLDDNSEDDPGDFADGWYLEKKHPLPVYSREDYAAMRAGLPYRPDYMLEEYMQGDYDVSFLGIDAVAERIEEYLQLLHLEPGAAITDISKENDFVFRVAVINTREADRATHPLLDVIRGCFIAKEHIDITARLLFGGDVVVDYSNLSEKNHIPYDDLYGAAMTWRSLVKNGYKPVVLEYRDSVGYYEATIVILEWSTLGPIVNENGENVSSFYNDGGFILESEVKDYCRNVLPRHTVRINKGGDGRLYFVSCEPA